MIISDTVYGKVKIDSPVIIELIKSKPIQRLKKIAQLGLPRQYYFESKYFNRFEHSVGTMILLKILGASEKEQIAGLLHDVSHTAFSHVIDYLVGSTKKENFQDRQHKKFIKSEELSKILKKHGYIPEEIFDYKNFGLLERDLPDACADRMDYTLRELSKRKGRKILNYLSTHDGKIIFTNRKIAHEFALLYIDRNVNNWASFEAVSRYRIFSGLLRYAMNKKYITFKDLWEYDEFVLKKLKSSKDKRVNLVLNILKNKSLKKMPLEEKSIHKKFRRIDPLFSENGQIFRLSEVDGKFAEELIRIKKFHEKGMRPASIKF